MLVVRLTSQIERSGLEFPKVTRGASRACCGELTSVRPSVVDLRARPSGAGARLTLGEMAAIGRGIASTHLLRDHIQPSEWQAAQESTHPISVSPTANSDARPIRLPS